MEFHPNDLSDLDDLTEEHLGFSALSDGLGFAKPTPKHRPLTVPTSTDQVPVSGIGATAAGPARPAPSITKSPASLILAEPAAPQGIRLVAFGLDALIISIPLTLAWIFSFGGNAWDIFLLNPKSPLSLFAMIFGAYFLLSESFGGQSLGKMVLGLRVVEDDKYEKPTGLRHAILRLGLFLLGALCFGLGFLASFWDNKRRPWHDRYSGSIVRRKA